MGCFKEREAKADTACRATQTGETHGKVAGLGEVQGRGNERGERIGEKKDSKKRRDQERERERENDHPLPGHSLTSALEVLLLQSTN